MGDKTNSGFFREVETEVAKPELQEPPMYKVLLINDDYTPMDFVVEILRYFFMLNEALATDVMLQVHKNGKAVCGTYSRDIAETKVMQVNEYSRSHEYPLLCQMEKV